MTLSGRTAKGLSRLPVIPVLWKLAENLFAAQFTLCRNKLDSLTLENISDVV
jgi:hypothetical protein